MSYISKNTGAFINARLTDKGRELLSIGLLNFSAFRLGDSEVDYRTLGQSYNIALQNVLKPKSHQPNIKTPILPTSTAITPDVTIGQISPIELITITAEVEKGFFDVFSGTTEFTAKTTSDYVVLSDLVTPISGMTGGNLLNVEQGVGFVPNGNEPTVGDFVLIKMSTPELTGFTQTVGVVDENIPVPYLWYKIQSFSGTVSANTLTVEVDRSLPDFSYNISPNLAEVYIYPHGNLLFDNGLYSGGTVWNMNNVWTYNMPGIDESLDEGFFNYGSESFVGSKEYYGYTTEKQRDFTTTIINPEDDIEELSFCEYVNSISILHYSNFVTCENQPELVYGQKFYVDTDLGESPVVKMPTIMWHKNPTSGTTIGANFVAFGEEKFVTLNGDPTEISYYDLIEENEVQETNPHVVGRVFHNLQTITIDDQELVAAMSYKSNRNWTLPTLNFGTETATDGLFSLTQDVFVTYMFESSSGYTTSLPNQNIVCVSFSDDCGPDAVRKNLKLTFPLGELPYMNLPGGLGWYADILKVLVQRVPKGQLPNSDEWREIDLTSMINNHNVGDRIDPLNLQNTVFTVTNTLYNSANIFSLRDYIDIPQIGETNILQFGDEQFFYGNIESAGVITKYRTQFDFVIPPNQWNFSQNPTFPNSGKNVHISEIGIYDNQGNLVAIGKYIIPIEKTNTTTIILEVALDF